MTDTPLAVGDRAPDFSIPDGDGNTVRLADLRGKTVVLYFYPRDNTPGCTAEACGFRDRYADFQANDIVILGVSTDSAKKHQNFTKKYDLPFPLLVDTEAEISTAYGVYRLKKFMGKEYMGIVRSTFVIDPEGTIAKIYNKVKAEPHPAEVLADLGVSSNQG
ncbi:MAG: thioredoxin-dependent thiol peroxidase [Geitlerinemataceae cyanobacterium]